MHNKIIELLNWRICSY